MASPHAHEPHIPPPLSSDRTRHLSRSSASPTLEKYVVKGEDVPATRVSQTSSRKGKARTISISTNIKHSRTYGLIHFVVLCCCTFGAGWNDGSIGPLLPAFQRQYQLGYLIVSLYFVANCLGFILGAALNVLLNGTVGFGKIMVAGSAFQLVAYTLQAAGPPFPIMVTANLLTGLGLSLTNSQANGFVSSLSDGMETKLGFLHASYGLGAFVSPFVATYFSGRRRWSFHYLVSASIAVLNTLAVVLVFRFKRMDDLLLEGGQAPAEHIASPLPHENTYLQLLGLKVVHTLTVFALIYIGIEVTVGGWIVTFIIRERGGGHASGFISSGFFGGLVLGRVGLMWLNKLVGEHLVIMLYSFIAIILEITIWFVPSIIGNAIAVSLIGLVLGPMLPVMISHASKVLPRWLLTVCIGWITSIGMIGSAAVPFLTGLVSSRFGIASLQPLMVSMLSAMLLVWALVPRGSGRRVD